MDRNGIAGERVHREDIEALWRLAFQCQPRVAQQYGGRTGTIGEKSEFPARDLDIERIDFIEAKCVAGTAIASDHARAESDHTDPHRSLLFKILNGPANAGRRPVVSGRRAAELRVRDLRAVIDGAVYQVAQA